MSLTLFNDVIVFIVLNMFQTFFKCFIVDLEQVNVSWVDAQRCQKI